MHNHVHVVAVLLVLGSLRRGKLDHDGGVGSQASGGASLHVSSKPHSSLTWHGSASLAEHDLVHVSDWGNLPAPVLPTVGSNGGAFFHQFSVLRFDAFVDRLVRTCGPSHGLVGLDIASEQGGGLFVSQGRINVGSSGLDCVFLAQNDGAVSILLVTEDRDTVTRANADSEFELVSASEDVIALEAHLVLSSNVLNLFVVLVHGRFVPHGN